MTGSNWFRSEHILKEQSEAQNVVSRGCRRLYDRREKRKKARKKTPWSRSHEVFIMVGDNRIELVPQRTSFEGAKRRANDRERGCRRLYDRREKRKKARKKTPWSRSHEVFIMVGDNRIELVPQRTSFEGAKRRANDRERGCRRLYDRREKGKRQEKSTTERIT